VTEADLKALLNSLHSELAAEFLRRVKSGEATAADLSAARQFLKDNNIDGIVKAGGPTHQLAKMLPFTSTEDAYPH
jgi:hypothetical protein